VSALQSGIINTGVTALALSGTLSNGMYYLGAIADYNNLIREGSETNNGLSTMTINIRAGIDLAVASASAPATAVTGSTLSLSNIVRNLGTDNAPVSALGVYLSTDPIITTTDTRIGAPSIAALASGQSLTNGTAVYLPNYVAAGSYYLGVIADYANALPETDEVNNILMANAISITVGADLTVRSVTGPASVIAGTAFNVSNVVQNIGAGDSATNSRVGVYLSDDAVITTNDVLIGFRNINSILAGTTNIGGNPVTVPGSVTSGAYYIGAIADYQDRVLEISEDNNAMGYPVLVGMTPFRITQIRIDGADVLITFESRTGETYAVQEAQSIGGTINWVPVAGATAISGTGSTIEFRHPGVASTAPRFYRIQQSQ